MRQNQYGIVKLLWVAPSALSINSWAHFNDWVPSLTLDTDLLCWRLTLIHISSRVCCFQVYSTSASACSYPCCDHHSSYSLSPPGLLASCSTLAVLTVVAGLLGTGLSRWSLSPCLCPHSGPVSLSSVLYPRW